MNRAAGVRIISLTPLKRTHHLLFFLTYQAFKSQVPVQGDWEYIFTLSFGKLINFMVICFYTTLFEIKTPHISVNRSDFSFFPPQKYQIFNRSARFVRFLPGFLRHGKFLNIQMISLIWEGKRNNPDPASGVHPYPSLTRIGLLSIWVHQKAGFAQCTFFIASLSIYLSAHHTISWENDFQETICIWDITFLSDTPSPPCSRLDVISRELGSQEEAGCEYPT